MKFSLRQMQVFHSVAEHQSVSEAAKTLNMSQSAASMALAQLETMLGKPLFHRNGRNMQLSHWGLWLRPQAHQLLANCHTIEQGMEDLDLVSGLVSFGASQTPARYLLPALICRLDQDFPHLQVTLGVENTEHIVAGLLEYRYDIGLIEGHCDDERLIVQSLCEDELVIVCSKRHPFASKERVTMNQLAMTNWVLRERGAGTRDIFDTTIHEHIQQVKVHREFDQAGVILEMVAQGQYLTCLSRRSVNHASCLDQLTILPIPELKMVRNLSFVWRRQELESPSRSVIIKTAISLFGKHQKS